MIISEFLRSRFSPQSTGMYENYIRSMRMFAVGLSQGPPHHYWYEALDKRLPGKTAAIIGKKILADQIFAAPFFAVTFIVFAALLEGKRLAQVRF